MRKIVASAIAASALASFAPSPADAAPVRGRTLITAHCEYEDGSGPRDARGCYWDGGPNGVGLSYVVMPGGATFYIRKPSARVGRHSPLVVKTTGKGMAQHATVYHGRTKLVSNVRRAF